MSDQPTPVTPDPEPRLGGVTGPEWGQTSQPMQEPADKPRGAKAGFLIGVGVVVLVAVILLIVALVRS